MNKKAKLTIFNMVLLAMMAAIGIAVKVVVGPLIKILTGSIGIPGGAVAGGFYMLWMSLGIGITQMPFSASIIALIQALVVMLTGVPGSHAALSLLTYTLPGLACDLIFLISHKKNYNMLHYIIGTMLANIVGTAGSNLLFFQLPFIPLMLMFSAAGLSGALGGVTAYFLVKSLKKINILNPIVNIQDVEVVSEFKKNLETDNDKSTSNNNGESNLPEAHSDDFNIKP